MPMYFTGFHYDLLSDERQSRAKLRGSEVNPPEARDM